MTLNTKRLTDSLTFRTITTDKFKTGMLALSVTMPKNRFSSAYNYLLSGIMRRGTASYPSMASLNRRLDELYAAAIEVKTTKHGSNDTFLITAELLDNDYADDGTDIADGTLEVMAELLLSPLFSDDGLFPEDNVCKEKKIAADNMRAIINNPRAYASLRLSELVRRDDPEFTDLAASIATVEAIDRQIITEYYQSEIASRPIDVFYVGGLDEDEIEKKILKYLGTHRAHKREKTVVPSPAIAKREPLSHTETMPLSQGKLALAFRTGICLGEGDHYALVLLNEILGGSPASKLFMNVREGMSLCYYCSSSYNKYTGTLSVSSGIECTDRERAEAAILKQLDDIKRGSITPTELDAARKSLKNIYNQIYDNPFDLHAFYSSAALFGRADTVESCRERLAEVTLDDVIRVAGAIELDTVYFLCGTAESGEEENYE